MKLARLRGRILIGYRARSSLSRSERADEKTPRTAPSGNWRDPARERHPI